MPGGIGMCLPWSCQESDLYEIVRLFAHEKAISEYNSYKYIPVIIFLRMCSFLVHVYMYFPE